MTTQFWFKWKTYVGKLTSYAGLEYWIDIRPVYYLPK